MSKSGGSTVLEPRVGVRATAVALGSAMAKESTKGLPLLLLLLLVVTYYEDTHIHHLCFESIEPETKTPITDITSISLSLSLSLLSLSLSLSLSSRFLFAPAAGGVIYFIIAYSLLSV